MKYDQSLSFFGCKTKPDMADKADSDGIDCMLVLFTTSRDPISMAWFVRDAITQNRVIGYTYTLSRDIGCIMHHIADFEGWIDDYTGEFHQTISISSDVMQYYWMMEDFLMQGWNLNLCDLDRLLLHGIPERNYYPDCALMNQLVALIDEFIAEYGREVGWNVQSS